MLKAKLAGNVAQAVKFCGCPVAINRAVIEGGAQVLAEGDAIAPHPAQVLHRLDQLCFGFAMAHH
jgi:hypothetical protein